jgi:hypothetical protein
MQARALLRCARASQGRPCWPRWPRPHSYAAVPAAAARCGAMTDSTITLYSDCLSPFSFFAFTVIDRYVKVGLWPAELVLKPILLGGVMAATGNLPPGACVHAHAYA